MKFRTTHPIKTIDGATLCNVLKTRTQELIVQCIREADKSNNWHFT